jgi:Domain of Unknown Function with PDB structure (DUF3857)
LNTHGRVGLFLFLLLGSLCFSHRSVHAGDEWLPIDPAELKMTSEPKAPGAPAIYLYRQVDRDDSGTSTSEHDYNRIKILTEEGRRYADIEIPFSKESYNVSRIKARTIHPDGSIVNFDGKVFEKTVVKSKTLKYLAKTFTMPAVTVGSIVEYHFNYDFTDNYIFNSRWILSEELFTKHAKFSLKPYSRDTWVVEWLYPAGLPPGTVPAKQDPDRVIRMVTDNIPAFQIEDYMPPEDELKLRVDFIYNESTPEMNPEKFWANFGKKQNGRVESFVDKRKAMEQAVGQIVSPGDSAEVKLRKIYARTQQVRNLSYEMSKTEQEDKREKLKLASNVEEVWKRGYADGASITWLFLGLARAAGVEAYPCLVSSRAQYFFTKARLNSAELNTNVVLVKLNGKDMYLDPGAAFTPYGLLPWHETGVTGLKLDKEGGKWIETTLPPSDASQVLREANLKLTEEGNLEGTLKVTYTGLRALSHRDEQRNQDAASRKTFLEDLVKESVPSGIEVELTNQPDWLSSDSALVAEFNLKVPGWVSGAGRKALFPAGLFGGSEKHLFEHSARVQPIYFSYPYKKIDRIKVELPLGWKATTLVKPIDQDLKAAEYKLSTEEKDGALHIQREIRSDIIMVPQNAYPTLRSFFQIVRTQDEQQIVLQPGGASASQ